MRNVQAGRSGRSHKPRPPWDAVSPDRPGFRPSAPSACRPSWRRPFRCFLCRSFLRCALLCRGLLGCCGLLRRSFLCCLLRCFLGSHVDSPFVYQRMNRNEPSTLNWGVEIERCLIRGNLVAENVFLCPFSGTAIPSSVGTPMLFATL